MKILRYLNREVLTHTLAVSAVWWAGRLGQIGAAFLTHAAGRFADIGGERGSALHYLVRLPEAAGVVLLLVAGGALAALARVLGSSADRQVGA